VDQRGNAIRSRIHETVSPPRRLTGTRYLILLSYLAQDLGGLLLEPTAPLGSDIYLSIYLSIYPSLRLRAGSLVLVT